MKRRTFAMGALLGMTGCLRTVQSQTESEADGTTRSSENSTTTGTEAETETTSRPAAMPKRFDTAWSKNGASGLTSFRDETLFCAYNGVTAFAPDGSERWSRNLAGRNYKGLFLGPERVYVPTQIGTIHAFDPDNGEELWRSELPDGGDGRSVPIPFGSVVIVNSNSPNQEVALDAETGEVRWTSLSGLMGIQNRLPIPGDASPNADVFVDVSSNEITTLAPDGSVVATQPTIQPTTPPTFEGETVYVGGRSTFGKFDVRDGTIEWTTETPSKCLSQPVVTDDHVVVATVDNGVFAFNKADGSEGWHADLGRVRWSPVRYRGGLYTGVKDGTCHVLDPESGETVISAEVGVANATLPAIGDDAIYYVGGNSAADIVRTDISFDG